MSHLVTCPIQAELSVEQQRWLEEFAEHSGLPECDIHRAAITALQQVLADDPFDIQCARVRSLARSAAPDLPVPSSEFRVPSSATSAAESPA